MVLGEVLNFPGKWSSYPPHHHPQPEVYFYRFDYPHGFGAGFANGEIYQTGHNGLAVINHGFHSQTAAPGYAMPQKLTLLNLDFYQPSENYTPPNMNEPVQRAGIIRAVFRDSVNGFQVPYEIRMRYLARARDPGINPYFFSSVEYTNVMNQQMAQQTSLTQGVYVYSVTDGGAAAKAGIMVGDVITKIDDTTITSLEDLTAAKKSYSAGDTSTFTIYRDGKSTTLKVTWGAASKETSTTTDSSTSSNSNQSQSGNNYYGSNDTQDLFDYFFNQYGSGNSGSSNGQSGTGTAA